MRTLVTGGAGFLGSHLCERLVADGHDVVCYDSLLTGSRDNLAALDGNPRFSFREYDVTTFLEVDGPVDWVLHFASPASPADYLRHPILTLKLGALATLNCLGLARARGAGFFLASTSEVYGDPLVHPQPESYWGKVNPVGVRSVYDEAKRYAEAATMAYQREHGVPVRIARIFNTYGPRMRRYDGRAIPAFVGQALEGKPMTVHGDGSQTRSLCYVEDTVEGFVRLLRCDRATGPVNIILAMVAILGLLPASIATGLGSDVQRPMATVIVWGLFSSTILTLFVVPVLYRIVSPGLPKPEEPEEAPPLEPEAAQHMIT